MQIKLLIVDDEPIICRGLQSTVPWASIGVEVIGEAYDGLEALELIARQEVDVVITDICMPEMDGLELTRVLREQKPDIKVIIVSGYDEFEYARQAMRLGVEDFLLKPVNVEELMGMVERISEQKSREKEEERTRIQDNAVKWLSGLMQGDTTYSEADLGLFSQVDAPARFHVIASQMDCYSEWLERSEETERDSLQPYWREHIQSCLASNGISTVSYYFHRNLLLTLCMEPEGIEESQYTGILYQVAEQWIGPESLYLGISEPFLEMGEARAACYAAIQTLQYRLLCPGSSVIQAAEAKQLQLSRPALSAVQHEKKVIEALIQGDEMATEQGFEEWLEYYRSTGCLLKEFLQAYEALRALIHHLWPNGALKEGLDGQSADLTGIDLNVLNTWEAIERCICEDFGRLSRVALSLNEGKNHWVIEQSRKHIIEHQYTDIKASDVAARLQLTPNYFSMIFKQNAGRSFTEYLNEMRIDRAKQLLSHSSDRVFEIAEKVGYKEYKYFVTMFKTNTGLTPTDYRKRYTQ